MNGFKITAFLFLGLCLIGFSENAEEVRDAKYDKVIPAYPPLKEIKELASKSEIVAILKISESELIKEFVVDKVVKGELAKDHFELYTLEVDPLMPTGAFFVYFFGADQDNPGGTFNSLVAVTADKIEVVGGERILFKGYVKEEIISAILPVKLPEEKNRTFPDK